MQFGCGIPCKSHDDHVSRILPYKTIQSLRKEIQKKGVKVMTQLGNRQKLRLWIRGQIIAHLIVLSIPKRLGLYYVMQITLQ